MKKVSMAVAAAMVASAAFSFEYNVRQPSSEMKPALTGATAGKWTFDYDAAQEAAKAAGKCHILLVTGSWWCPHCEAFEEKVVLSDLWRRFIADNGFYLSMIDFPYRAHVSDDQISKSVHPEMGDGWGFNCWLYNDEYLAENGLTREDGLKKIQQFYGKQNELALPDANTVTIKTWDGTADFTYGRVGYPTLIIFLPDGTEAGRFVPYVTNMNPAEAREYVLGQINTIIAEALDAQCGLCSDPDDGGLAGDAVRKYLGWLPGAESGIDGTISVTTSRANTKGEIKVKASINLKGKKISLSGVATNPVNDVTLVKSGKSAHSATLRFGAHGFSGTYTDGTKVWAVTGALDAFSAPRADVEAAERAASLELGSWNLAMRPADVNAPMAGGFGSLTVTIKAKGKAKITGRLGDGTNVSLKGQVIMGDDGVGCLPVVANLYAGKTGGFSCNLWFRNGWLFNVTDIGDWKCTKKGGEFATAWYPIYTATDGYGEIAEDMELLFETPLPDSMFGLALENDPDADSITAKKNKWTGTEASGFSATVNKRTGTITGSMFLYGRNGSRLRKIKAKVYGVVIGNSGYLTMIVNNLGSWAAKVSACAACED